MIKERSLSKSQAKVLKAIRSFIQANKYPPTIREIGDLVNLKSTSTVHLHFQNLKEKGYIDFVESQPRALWITERGEQYE
ncbi:LexA repressor [Jeotgalibacillus proteolyticus]|uniref:LexA repressor n=1 Tax=Jeotgalibacillus proteolyticus TaxID=2082395 RepID=A0A2S5GAS9_9BACL|nr:LexA repressor [Jeotgalibacillus proteolyticus]PPA70078.1 LexA repressor [Jeotgalibacillus proteolyticus]